MKDTMVRFARADGSKGSNKRQLEEATPWIEMVKQIESNKKMKSKKKMESRRDDDGTLGETTKKKKIKLDDSEESITSQNMLQYVTKEKFEAKKEESNESTQAAQILIKKRKKEKKDLKTKDPEYTITSEGKRVKVFRDGTQRTWFDLPYEESDLMTRYEGMWVKQEVVDELDRLKATLEEEGLSKKEVRRPLVCMSTIFFFYKCFAILGIGVTQVLNLYSKLFLQVNHYSLVGISVSH